MDADGTFISQCAHIEKKDSLKNINEPNNDGLLALTSNLLAAYGTC